MLPDVVIAPEAAADAAAIERLHEAAFGPGRFARTAFRIRERADPAVALCFVAHRDGALVASVRLTPVTIGEVRGLLLGPLAVTPALAGKGIGRALLATAVDAARAAGHGMIILVGDLPYYGPFGFSRVEPAGRITLPGPADPARILIAELQPGAAGTATGLVRAGWDR